MRTDRHTPMITRPCSLRRAGNNNCHTHFTHFPKPKWQTILEQLLNFRKKLLFLLTNNSLGNIKSKYKTTLVNRIHVHGSKYRGYGVLSLLGSLTRRHRITYLRNRSAEVGKGRGMCRYTDMALSANSVAMSRSPDAELSRVPLAVYFTGCAAR